MSAAKVIKQLMVERDVSVKELSERLGMKTPQLLSNKLYRDTFTYEDYIKIVNMLDCTVQTVTNDTAKIFTNDSDSFPVTEMTTTVEKARLENGETSADSPGE